MCIIESDVGHTTRTITNIAKLSGRTLIKIIKILQRIDSG
jgi:hypothetical protein